MPRAQPVAADVHVPILKFIAYGDCRGGRAAHAGDMVALHAMAAAAARLWRLVVSTVLPFIVASNFLPRRRPGCSCEVELGNWGPCAPLTNSTLAHRPVSRLPAPYPIPDPAGFLQFGPSRRCLSSGLCLGPAPRKQSLTGEASFGNNLQALGKGREANCPYPAGRAQLPTAPFARGVCCVPVKAYAPLK